jgi:hypothetical protein
MIQNKQDIKDDRKNPVRDYMLVEIVFCQHLNLTGGV